MKKTKEKTDHGRERSEKGSAVRYSKKKSEVGRYPARLFILIYHYLYIV